MSKRPHALLGLVFAAFASGALAAPGADATRGELRAWFGELRTSGVRIDGVLRWEYRFAAADARPLEALSVALVGAGYGITSLGTVAGGEIELRVVKSEPHTPTTLERRNEELAALAPRHGGARYLGAAPLP